MSTEQLEKNSQELEQLRNQVRQLKERNKLMEIELRQIEGRTINEFIKVVESKATDNTRNYVHQLMINSVHEYRRLSNRLL